MYRYLTLTILLSSWPCLAVAQADSCSSMLKHGITNALKEHQPDLSSAMIQDEICDNPVGPTEKGKGIERFDGIRFKRKELKRGMERLYCKKNRDRKSKRIRRILRSWLSRPSAKMFDRCLRNKKKRVIVKLNVSPSQDLFNLTIGGKGVKKINPKDLIIEPAGAFECTGTLVKEQRIIGDYDFAPLYASCKRNLDRKEPVQIAWKRYTFEFPTYQEPSYDPGFFEDRFPQEEIPEIPDCFSNELDPTILHCSTAPSYQSCVGELVSGNNIRDCRGTGTFGAVNNFDYVVLPPTDDQHTLTVYSSLFLTVRQSERGRGVSTGFSEYTLELETPIRPPAAQCEPEDAELCSASRCDRGCILGDGLKEDKTGATANLFAIGRLEDPSCSRSLSGSITHDEVDLYRAWEQCDRENAWGGTTSIDIISSIGKLYQFDNPRTESVRRNGVTRVHCENSAEIVNQSVEVRAPVTVNCLAD